MTNDARAEMNAIADRFAAAVEAGDVAAIRGMFAPEAVIWHNTDRVEQTVEQNLAATTWFVRNTATRAFSDVRRTITADGFSQQHVFALGFSDGRTAELAGAQFVTISNGLVTRLDEYLDSAAVSAAFSGGRSA